MYSGTLGREVARPGDRGTADRPGGSAAVRHGLPARSAGHTTRDRVPQLYRTWAPSAWVDLLATLPDEHAAGEVAAAAEAEFRRLVATALHRIVSMGREVQERRATTPCAWSASSNARCCNGASCARPGRQWGSIRGYALWCRRVPLTLALDIAFRRDLFGQVGPPELARLRQRELSDLCIQYGVGRPDRAGGDRAIVLLPEYLADLAAAPDEGEVDDVDAVDASGACAREASSASSASTCAHTDAPPCADTQENPYADE
jgi:hypothetical protein